jgi:hypothetical protein
LSVYGITGQVYDLTKSYLQDRQTDRKFWFTQARLTVALQGGAKSPRGAHRNPFWDLFSF